MVYGMSPGIRKRITHWFSGSLPLLISIVAPLLLGQSNQLSGERAFFHAQRIVSFGPRPPGSAGIKRAQRYLTDTLKNYPLEVEHQNFLAMTPNGEIPMKNIVARTKSSPNDFIILASHYDTLLMKNGVFVGANDGASSTGLLLELAQLLSSQKWKFSLWFVFFDGEEAQQLWTAQDSLYGSTYFVERLQARGQVSKIKAMILMDMVGDKDLVLENDTTSTAWLMALVRDSAKELGHGRQLGDTPKAIIDDHVPFLRVGIPAVNLIDYEFGRNNEHWHTPQDTLDKISPKSLQVTGEIVLKTLKKLSEKYFQVGSSQQ